MLWNWGDVKRHWTVDREYNTGIDVHIIEWRKGIVE